MQMLRTFGAAALLTLAVAMPAQDAMAQDPLGGALLGGAIGAGIGAAAGGNRGILPGAIIGATAGAIIAAEGQRRRGGYYYHRGGCYLQRADGAWIAVAPRYCGGPGPAYYGPAPGPADADAIAYCARRYRSYDPASQTYLGNDGFRHPCP
jgi:hypothetical protein